MNKNLVLRILHKAHFIQQILLYFVQINKLDYNYEKTNFII